MANPKETFPLSPEKGQNNSPAAGLILAMRQTAGNGSSYDQFLCNFTGEGVPLSPNFQPIDRRAPSGAVYSYNNPYLVGNAYSRSGLVINYRRASQPVRPGEENFEFFVATLDLRKDEATVWEAAEVYKSPNGKEIRVGLTKQPVLSSVDARAGLTAGLSARADQQCDAWLLLDQDRGSCFIANGRWESLESLDRLVAEVNTLTEEHALRLDAIRERASHQLAEVIPLAGTNVA